MAAFADVQVMIDALLNEKGSGPIGRGELQRVLEAMMGADPGEVGTAGAGVTPEEFGHQYRRTTVLTVDGVLPDIPGGANLGVGLLVYTFPAGRILVNSISMSLAIQQVDGNITADTPDVGMGTVIATGAVAVLGGTATFENLINGSAAADCDGTPTVAGGVPTANVPLLIAAGDAHTVHFNAADGWAASGDDAAIVEGSVVINWDFLD